MVGGGGVGRGGTKYWGPVELLSPTHCCVVPTARLPFAAPAGHPPQAPLPSVPFSLFPPSVAFASVLNFHSAAHLLCVCVCLPICLTTE